MMKKQDIHRIVTHRCCPKCGYILDQVQVDMMRLDFKCQRCGEHKVSEFQPMGRK